MGSQVHGVQKNIITLLLIVVFSVSYAQTAYPDWKIYNSTNSPLDYNRVFEVTQDNLGNYWVGIDDGVAKFDGINWTTYTTANSNIHDRVLTVFFDGSKLWLGHGLGLSTFNGTTFNYYNLDQIFGSYYQGCNTIKGFDKDKQGNIWIATGNGLVKYNGSSFNRYTNMIGQNQRAWAVKCDTVNNHVWVGTYSAGLQRFNGTTFTQLMFNDTSDHSNPIMNWGDFQQVNKITFDNQGDIWATGYGINEFDKLTLQRKSTYNSQNTNSGVGDPLVWGIAFDQNNKMWIGSDCLKGIFVHDNSSWITYNNLNSPIPQGTCYWAHANILVNKYNTKLIPMDYIGLVVYREGGVILNINDEKENNFDIFPNPVIDKLTISSKKEMIKSVEVFDLSGRKLNCDFINSVSDYSLNTTNLASGVYFLKTTTNKGTITNKIIKE